MTVGAVAQFISTDSMRTLEKKLLTAKMDTGRVDILRTIGSQHLLSEPDLARKYFQEGLELSRKLNYKKGEADCLRWTGNLLKRAGQYPEAMDYLLKALKIAEDINYRSGISAAYGHLGDLYLEQGEYAKSRLYFFPAKKIDEETDNHFEMVLMYLNIGRSYQLEKRPDSATYYFNLCFQAMGESESRFKGRLLTAAGELEVDRGNDEKAIQYFRESIFWSLTDFAPSNLSDNFIGLAKLFRKSANRDSGIFYAQKALTSARQVKYLKGVMAANQLLSDLYEGVDNNESFRYYKMTMEAKDSLFNAEKVKQVQNLGFLEQQRIQAIEDARVDFRNKMRLYGLLSLLAAFLVIAVLLFRNNRNKQRANKVLNEQKVELQKALSDLKTTQAQLVQSEKMASLGELTAGIAHEIQNPLNFVNNFSEVNTELIQELRSQNLKGKNENGEGIDLEILNDIEKNLEKISHHGKRADEIVKGMLQHSRSSAGQKEPTDINGLCDEYLRLAFHGMRAKDKSFNAETKTDFDTRIGTVNVVSQDVGRVLLNLLNNAFYATNERRKKNEPGYQPMVEVTTRKEARDIKIEVTDNGPGIPEKIRDKIFQPFFTTKPTGQGTGLGLSLSYDMVKAQGGDIRVETKEREYTRFIVTLPA